MKKIFFVLNSLMEFDFGHSLEKYLIKSEYQVSVGEGLPHDTGSYDLIILWNYKKILKDITGANNIIVFHSTNLPEGKGWAPIFYSLAQNKEYFYITGILATDEVDAGDIIVQAKYSIKNNYTAKYLRMWDTEICILLIKRILEKFPSGKVTGKKQVGESSFNVRRTASDNELDINQPLINQINLLRGCEDNFPAYFIYNNAKYKVYIKPEEEPGFPQDLEIIFPV